MSCSVLSVQDFHRRVIDQLENCWLDSCLGDPLDSFDGPFQILEDERDIAFVNGQVTKSKYSANDYA